jgi:hypothetical protein
MNVITLVLHANNYGVRRRKDVGDIYYHPSPATLIGMGFVAPYNPPAPSGGEPEEEEPA